MSTPPQHSEQPPAAILLAGGEGRRLGGVNKAMLRHRGMTLLASWTQALATRSIPTVVVGPNTLRQGLPEDMALVREDPPLSGPAAAVHAGVRAHHQAQTSGYVLLLAVDVVDPGPLLDWLLRQIQDADAAHRPAIVPVDVEERKQYLTSALPAQELRSRVQHLSTADIAGRPLRVLFEGIDTVTPQMPPGVGADIDAPADAAHHGIVLPDRDESAGQ